MFSYIIFLFVFQMANCQVPVSPHRSNFYNESAYYKTIILFEKDLAVANWTNWSTSWSVIVQDNFILLFTNGISAADFHTLSYQKKMEALAVGTNNVAFQTLRSILADVTITGEYDFHGDRNFRNLRNYQSYQTIFRTKVQVLEVDCQSNEDCPPNSYCSHRGCQCYSQFAPTTQMTCMPASTYGQSCNIDEQCWNLFSELFCTMGKCRCDPAQDWSSDKNWCISQMQISEIYSTTKSVLNSVGLKVIVSKEKYPVVNFIQSDFLFKSMGPVIFKTDDGVKFLTATYDYQFAFWKNYSQTYESESESESAFSNPSVLEQVALVKSDPVVGFYFDEEFRVNEQILDVHKFNSHFAFDAGVCMVSITNASRPGEFRVFTHWVEGLGTMKSCGVFFNEPISLGQITLWYKNVSFSEVYVAGAVTKSSSVQIPIHGSSSSFRLREDDGNAKIQIVVQQKVPVNLALCHRISTGKLISTASTASTASTNILWWGILSIVGGVLTVLIIGVISWRLEFSKAPIYTEVENPIYVARDFQKFEIKWQNEQAVIPEENSTEQEVIEETEQEAIEETEQVIEANSTEQEVIEETEQEVIPTEQEVIPTEQEVITIEL